MKLLKKKKGVAISKVGLGNIFDGLNDEQRIKNPQNGGRSGKNNGGNNGNKGPNVPKTPLIYYTIAVLVIMLFLNFFVYPELFSKEVEPAYYNEFVEALDKKQVDQIEISENSIVFSLKDNDRVLYETGMIDIDSELVDRMLASGADFTKEIPESVSPILLLLYNMLPIIIFLGFGYYLSKKMQSSMGGLGGMPFGKSNAKIYQKDTTGVTFKDVAGEDEAKELLTEIVDFLHRPEKYKAIGARIPKGALLVGPPGTGKTLLAKAVAGEADVPFFSISGSEFVEMFVGMGAAKVRDLFKQAEDKAPCIIFIDEIDAIGKKRGANGISGNDEREQTLNQLLTEMDGFDGTKGVVVLAATNQPDALDPALLRPGRFDRRIPVELPDMIGREDILKVHAKDVKMAGNVDLTAIAKACPGASGAELANIINEAALRAVRAGRERVIQSDLEESIEVVIAGYQKKNKVLSDKEKLIVAYHEVGHAMVAAKQTNSAPVHKITIIPRTSGALGYTMQVDDDGNHYLLNKEELENKIATLTGGRAAEEIIFNTCTTGASNDIEQATKIARQMVMRYGMSKDFDMVAMENVSNQYLGGDASVACSPETMRLIDKEVVELVKKQHEKAVGILKDNLMKLHEIVKYLYEKETITGEEFMGILNSEVNTLTKSTEETERVISEKNQGANENGTGEMNS